MWYPGMQNNGGPRFGNFMGTVENGGIPPWLQMILQSRAGASNGLVGGPQPGLQFQPPPSLVANMGPGMQYQPPAPQAAQRQPRQGGQRQQASMGGQRQQGSLVGGQQPGMQFMPPPMQTAASGGVRSTRNAQAGGAQMPQTPTFLSFLNQGYTPASFGGG